ncbi:MAG: M67 family metallopeptidase [Xanthomonadaceae bacterium]|nr:M67 family metallopeptidase [Xanthomonadaceae bacterium]
MSELTIAAAARARLLELAQAAYPEEGCGLLLGVGARVEQVWALANAAADRRRHYRLDPIEYMRAEQRADAAGLRVLGIWHSHPDAEPVPSAQDLADAWPGWSYVIVGTSAAGVTGLRSWRLRDGEFLEEVISP